MYVHIKSMSRQLAINLTDEREKRHDAQHTNVVMARRNSTQHHATLSHPAAATSALDTGATLERTASWQTVPLL